MTLLKEKDICEVSKNLMSYNKELITKTGTDLAGIALHATGIYEKYYNSYKVNSHIAVVPVSCGDGVINGFCETIKDIINILGFSSYVTSEKDISGIEEAYQRMADVIFIADDEKFIALNTLSRKVVDNGDATGRGYAAALDLVAGGIRDKEVLLIGAGPVGIGAAAFLDMKGAKISVYDIDKEKAKSLKKHIENIKIVKELDKVLPNFDFVLDATPAAGIIKETAVNERMIIAAPGIPLGIESTCVESLSHRIIHDVLEIGVATMLFHALHDF
ncbi:3-methylornithyl-N6-L-lysine dehydrogenase PylD [Pseudobacteroides cellulosolvens]|uniref:Pyrrolysine biosynthesis protein PylD n=1 Tax=Pseudobacteroides cellulosolvens ATCC 35603 = DSM 2933 TaxID=398512 RepID=A0A0L6JRF8_9FIRM|nr:3-methylornithyl-N6-L-lysine dehydrogenase PylD [Pseudobacteroides cellulosolvens]KNY27977.1 Pyrrolysine biosynthesis protein PylD [Pseudobacteroides cellulosolvens ATCC 35603 = DSM 2933]